MTERSPDDVLGLLAAREGHFLLESGHHGNLWLDLELLCRYPNQIKVLSSDLAKHLLPLNLDVVCGPLVEGALVGLFVAAELRCSFVYAERFARSGKNGLFPAGYRLPTSLRPTVQGRRTAIVNDVINAGSAVRGAFEDLESCGAQVIAIAALLTLGDAAQQFADDKNLLLHSLAELSNELWQPPNCPLCASGVPFEDVAGFRNKTS